MEYTKLPIRGIIGAFLTGTGVAVMGWINQPMGITLFILGLFIFTLEVYKYHRQKRLMSIPESVDKSKIVWGLWHTGAQISDANLITEGTSIKRVLLFDYHNKSKLYDVVEMGGANRQEAEVIGEIQRLIKQILSLKDTNTEVRLYSEPLNYSITIYERENDKVEGLYDFSDKAWIYGQYLLAKVRRDKRPSFLIMRKGNEQKSFEYYVREYQKIWDNARPIKSEQDM